MLHRVCFAMISCYISTLLSLSSYKFLVLVTVIVTTAVCLLELARWSIP